MVLNALSIDPKRPWKGSWRWFHEKLLDCCLPLDTVASEGVVLTQAACLAKCNGARVGLLRAGTFSLEEFRRQVR
jgi:glutathione gamma-glutamylcysteinyltransferase